MKLKSIVFALIPAAFMLLVVACGEGNHQKEIEEYTEAIRLNPQDVSTYTLRGQSYAGVGEYERAIQDYDEAMRLDPQSGWPHYYKGLAYGKLGRQKEAEALLERACELGKARLMPASYQPPCD